MTNLIDVNFILCEVFEFVGIYNGAIRLICKEFLKCTRNRKNVVIDGALDERRVIGMLRALNVETIRRLCVMDLRDKRLSILSFKNVEEIRFVNCCGAICCSVLKGAENVRNVYFEKCEFDDESDEIRKYEEVEFVECTFCNTVWMSNVMKERKFKEFEGKFSCNAKWVSGELVFDEVIGINVCGGENFETIDGMKEIDLVSCDDISCVDGMNELVRLCMMSCSGKFVNLVGLEILELYYCDLSESCNLDFVIGLEKLRVFRMMHCRGIEESAYGVIGNLRGLEELILCFCEGITMFPNGNVDFGFVNYLEKLKKLNICGHGKVVGIMWEKLEKLEELAVSCRQINEDMWRGMCGGLGRLKSLDLSNCVINNVMDFGEIGFGNMVLLEKLLMRGCKWITDGIVREVADGLKRLRYLDFKGCVVKNVVCLGNLERLEYLDVGCGRMDEATLRFFDKQLRRLRILYCRIDGKIDGLLFEFVEKYYSSHARDEVCRDFSQLCMCFW